MTNKGLECIYQFQALTFLAFSIRSREDSSDGRMTYATTMAEVASLCRLQYLHVDGIQCRSKAEAEALARGFPALRSACSELQRTFGQCAPISRCWSMTTAGTRAGTFSR